MAAETADRLPCYFISCLHRENNALPNGLLRWLLIRATINQKLIKGRTNMAKRTSSAVWEGNLREGKGKVKLGSGAFEGQYSFASRFEEGTGTNPEELIGAAHAGCFSMALAAGLTKAGHNPTRISTKANVSLEKVGEGFKITTIELNTEGEVPGIDEQTFRDAAESAKQNCPVSQALAGVDIKLNAKFVKSAAA